MTPVEDRLRELLHEAAPSSAGVTFAEVERGVRGHRRRVAVLSSVGTAVSVITIMLLVTLLPGRSGPTVIANAQQPAPSPTNSTVLLRPQPGAAADAVRFNGIVFRFPDDTWRAVGPAGCGEPADHTVTVGVWGHSCPIRPQPTHTATSVGLTPVYGPQFALSWRGRRTTWTNSGAQLRLRWPGEPAWVGEQRSGRSWTATLALPWLNAYISAEAPTRQQARALLDRVEVADTQRAIPASAPSIFLESLAGHDGDGVQRNTTVNNAADIKVLLGDLRSLTRITDPARACDSQWGPDTVLITIGSPNRSQQTVAVRFGGCQMATAGTGAAFATSPQLLDDVRRLLPSSGL